MAVTTAGGPNVPSASSKAQSSRVIPFRRATTYRKSVAKQVGPSTITASIQPIEDQITGVGYFSGLDLMVQIAGSTSSATIGWKEDAPWSAIQSLVVKDTNGDLVNLASGYEGYLFSLYGRHQTATPASSTDTANIYSQSSTASGSSAGNALFHLPVNIAVNNRDLWGIVGNQDRAESYFIRDDIADSGSLYSTAPTTLGTVQITRIYRNYAVPGPVNANGDQQEQVPPKFGILHFQTRSVNPTIPAAGLIDHPLQRLGYTIRALICILRVNSLRSSGETYAPTRISLLFGDQVVFTTTWQEQKQQMFERYGFDAPNGVIVFDAISDFLGSEAGGELGDDYWWTHGMSQATLEATYPTGVGTTGDSLVILTDDLQVPDNVDLYA